MKPLSMSASQKYKIVDLKVKDLPKNITVTKSPSGRYFCAMFEGRVIYQDVAKWMVLGWLQDNPKILGKAFAMLKN